MSYYYRRGLGGPYDDFPEERRNSNSFSEDQGGVKRKKPKWGNRRRRGGNKPVASPSNIDIDTPLFKQPSTPLNRSPRQSRSPANSRNFNSGNYRNDSYRSQPVNAQPYFDVREMSSFVEPQHSGPAWKWESYFKDCQSWQDKHKLAYYKSRCMALEFENQMLFDQIKSLIDENSVFASERGQVPSMRLTELTGQNNSSQRATNTNSKKQGKGKQRKSSATSDDNIVFDVPDSMVSIIEESMRHKLTLSQERKNEAAREKKANEDSKKNEKENEGPVIAMGVKRKEELEQLYGAKAATIHKLETALQLNFNRSCDTLKPQVWMAAPLNPETVE